LSLRINVILTQIYKMLVLGNESEMINLSLSVWCVYGMQISLPICWENHPFSGV